MSLAVIRELNDQSAPTAKVIVAEASRRLTTNGLRAVAHDVADLWRIPAANYA